MTTTPDTSQKPKSRAVLALGAYLHLEQLERNVKNYRSQYASALRLLRNALAASRVWRLPHWGHLEDADRKARFYGRVNDAEKLISFASARLWDLQRAQAELDAFPFRTIDDCFLGLFAHERRQAQEMCERIARAEGDGNKFSRERSKRYLDYAHQISLLGVRRSSTITPTQYVQGMNEALCISA